MIPISRPYFTDDESQAAADAVQSGWVAQGPRVSEFENAFAEYTGAEYAVAVSSGTAALHLCMEVLGIEHGDEVICPSMSHIATANSIVYTGGVPVFAEVRQDDFNLDPTDAEKKITNKTKAILVAHQLGMPADIDAFKDICSRHDLFLIEDAACAAGSSYKGRRIGSHSDLVCFSFHPRKIITTGEGGMITTPSLHYKEKLTQLRQHGMGSGSFERHNSAGGAVNVKYSEIGYNYRLTDIQAAIGLKQLSKLDFIVKERNRIADIFKAELGGIEWLALPITGEGNVSNYQSFALSVKANSPISRDSIVLRLNDSGIAAKHGVMTAHREPAYISKFGNVSLPVTERSADNSFLLPLFVPMTEGEIDAVIRAVKDCFMNSADRH